MPTEHALCISKRYIESTIEVLNEAIKLLELSEESLSGENLQRYHELHKKALEEKNVYQKVKNMLEFKNHTSVCLTTSEINREGLVKVFKERDE